MPNPKPAKFGIREFLYVIASLAISSIALPLGFIWEEATSSFRGGRQLSKEVEKHVHEAIAERDSRIFIKQLERIRGKGVTND